MNLYNELGPQYLHSLITMKDYTVWRNEKAIELPLCKTTWCKQLWNSLGNSFNDALTLDDFKSFMRLYDMNECNCSYCILCILKRI